MSCTSGPAKRFSRTGESSLAWTGERFGHWSVLGLATSLRFGEVYALARDAQPFILFYFLKFFE